VGTLIETGRGSIAPAEIISLLSGDVSGKAGPTAPAKGLTLQSVEYPPPA
jgi:tRNA U38,U39,U40 pseudouridine synthase TruA